jgi:hypothetical protein
MVAWWLGLIGSQCKSFLNALGYDFDALEENYIDVRPKNLQALRKNLTIIQQILNPDNDIHGVQSFIHQLKDGIYVKVSKFIHASICSVAEQLAIAVSEFSLSQAWDILAERKAGGMDSVLRDWISGVLKDIEYLQAIQEMEINPRKTRLSEMLNIVPISGLILSEFYQRENILKTTLEHWDPVWYQQHKRSGSHPPQIQIIIEPSSEPSSEASSEVSSEASPNSSDPLTEHHEHTADPSNADKVISSPPDENVERAYVDAHPWKKANAHSQEVRSSPFSLRTRTGSVA